MNRLVADFADAPFGTNFLNIRNAVPTVTGLGYIPTQENDTN